MTAPSEQPQRRPSVFFIKNHSSGQLFSEPIEDFIARPSRHAEFEGNKPRFLEWCHDASTEHAFFSLCEPQDRDRRTVKENPARLLHGVVADYDATIARAELMAGVARASTEYPVAYASATFSGGARLVWFFERPVAIFGPDHAKRLLSTLKKEMRLGKLLPGFDEPAFLDTARYFELGRDWVAVNPAARVSRTLVEFHSFQAAQKQDFSAQGPAIPVDVVAAEVERRWPDRWQGPFTVGAQGVRFWDASARNPTGAWIRETGAVAFTGEGRFLPWGEILGADFVRKYEQDRIVTATEDIFYAGNGRYWRRVQGAWRPENTETLRRHLISNGLSDRVRGNSMSEVNRALHTIEDVRRVDGAAPFLFRDEVLVRYDNQVFLNTARARPEQPEQARREWGDGFPWIAEFIEKLFPDAEQRSVFLGWLSRFYCGAVESRPKQGQVLVIAGPAEAGKTMLTNRIIAPLLGGSQEATAFLTGAERFNDRLFENPLWTVDDATGTADRRAHTLWTEMLKKVAANRHQTCRAMYQTPVTLEFLGRVAVTLNDDDESVAMLPALEHSAGDKFIFLLASSTKGLVDFEKAASIPSELPAFGSFLMGYQVPAELLGSHRFGVVSFKHPQLQKKASDNSPAAEFVDVVDHWRTNHFRASDDADWIGGAVDLLGELHDDPSLEYCRRTFNNPRQVGRFLARAARQGVAWIEEVPRHRDHGARYRIKRPELAGSSEPRGRCVVVKPSAAA